MMRLNRFIANCSVCSRRKADELILNDNVKVNGKVVNEFGTQVDETKDKVSVNGKDLILEVKKIYIMLNKPKGYITTSLEQYGRPCILDLIKLETRVFPIGRLDMETEGLILLTNDGEFSNKLMHPSNKIEKVYIAKVSGDITQEKIDKLIVGVVIDDYKTEKSKIERISQDELKITITEGKNRQVRKMCESVDLFVINLKRIKVGRLDLGDLETGKYRFLFEQEINNI